MKKIFSAILILAVILGLSGCFCFRETEAPPKITEGEFPFYIEFIFNGKTYIYEDAVVCSFGGYDASALFQKPRTWDEKFQSNGGYITNKLIFEETDSPSALNESRINEESKFMLSCGRGDYYMGESEYSAVGKPCFYYHEIYKIDEKTSKHEKTVLSEKQLEEIFGLKIVRFEFSEPIKNEFSYGNE